MQYVYFNENDYRNYAEPVARLELEKETGQQPNKKLVVQRLNQYVLGKQIASVTNMMIVLISAILIKTI
jgi:hypothetical protein